LSRLLHSELHKLDVPEQVIYKLHLMMYTCVHAQAPQYLLNGCQPVSNVALQAYGVISDLLVSDC